MGIKIHVETSVKACMDRIRALDTEELGFGSEDSVYRTKLDWEEYECLSDFDAGALIKKMADILMTSGWAYIVNDCDEDEPVCTTWYYLGDKVKNVCFIPDAKDPDMRDDFYILSLQSNFEGVLVLQDDIDILKLCAEQYATVGYEDTLTDYIEYLAESFCDIAGESEFSIELFADDTLSPLARKVFSPLIDGSTVFEYKDHDFEPNLGWEKKGYVKFSKEERAMLMGAAPGSVPGAAGKAGSRSNKKRRMRDVIADITSKEPVCITDKVFVIDGDKANDLATRIVACGGTVTKKVNSKTDYLVLNNHAKQCSSTKLNDYFQQIDKGNRVKLITFDMVEDALK